MTIRTSILLLILPAAAFAQAQTPAAQPAAPAQEPPRTWIDPDTGHRIHRITDEPNSTGFYFNINAYTPDGKTMVYSAPDGIHAVDLPTLKTRLVVPGSNLHAVVVGHKTNTVFFTKTDEHALYSANLDTGDTKKLADLPPRASVSTVNADETLAAGTFIEGEGGQDYGAQRVNPQGMSGPLVQPLNKGQMMAQRLAAKLPMTLFTLNLQTGKETPLLQHNTNWLNHLLFSPADPTLLMYCHEGAWQEVDRIWNIQTDGTHNELIHKRTMVMEIAGHEFWGLDGKTIWYDLQTPKGEDFWLASYNLETKERRWFHMQRNEWSIHFNVTADESLMCGDGGDPGQVAHAPDGEWIELFHPTMTPSRGAINQPDFIQPGVLHSEHLVNMSKHNYKLEPNVRFSPDKKMVFFTSNMFGPSYVFGVEVAKAQ
ncbi:MAG TPA: oligogalacturonate lyase family protein [Phycisphaerae bacterium]|nr:oligogalacturonate lyase family protein [Phycisphaerae bacterium]